MLANPERAAMVPAESFAMTKLSRSFLDKEAILLRADFRTNTLSLEPSLSGLILV